MRFSRLEKISVLPPDVVDRSPARLAACVLQVAPHCAWSYVRHEAPSFVPSDRVEPHDVVFSTSAERNAPTMSTTWTISQYKFQLACSQANCSFSMPWSCKRNSGELERPLQRPSSKRLTSRTLSSCRKGSKIGSAEGNWLSICASRPRDEVVI